MMCWKLPLDRHVLPVRLCEQPRSEQVDGDAAEGDADNGPALNLRRLDQPPDCLVDDQAGEHEESRAVRRADRISARLSPKVRLPPAGRAASASATSERPIAPASVTICAASESSASD